MRGAAECNCCETCNCRMACIPTRPPPLAAFPSATAAEGAPSDQVDLHGCSGQPCFAASDVASLEWPAANFNGSAQLVFRSRQSEQSSTTPGGSWRVRCLGVFVCCHSRSFTAGPVCLDPARPVSLHRRPKSVLLVPSFDAYPRFRLLSDLSLLSEAVSPFWA